MNTKSKQEQDAIDAENEREYQKSLKDGDKKSKANRGQSVEEGWTDGGGNFIATPNGVLTEAQEAQTKDGNWVKYQKFSDGSYEFDAPKKSAAPVEDEENGKSKKK